MHTHRITGTPTSFSRVGDELYVTLLEQDSPITLVVTGELADRLESVLFSRRKERRALLLTLVYDPATGRVTDFSVLS